MPTSRRLRRGEPGQQRATWGQRQAWAPVVSLFLLLAPPTRRRMPTMRQHKHWSGAAAALPERVCWHSICLTPSLPRNAPPFSPAPCPIVPSLDLLFQRRIFLHAVRRGGQRAPAPPLRLRSKLPTASRQVAHMIRAPYPSSHVPQMTGQPLLINNSPRAHARQPQTGARLLGRQSSSRCSTVTGKHGLFMMA